MKGLGGTLALLWSPYPTPYQGGVADLSGQPSQGKAKPSATPSPTASSWGDSVGQVQPLSSCPEIPKSWGLREGSGAERCYPQAHSCASLCHFPAPGLAHLGTGSLDFFPGCLSDPTETFFFSWKAELMDESGGGKGWY